MVQLDTAAFVREGVTRYAEARATVNHFQSCIYEMLMGTFEAKEDWKNFVPVRVDGAFQSGKAPGAVFLHTYIAGELRTRGVTGKAWLNLGMYWEVPFRKAALAVVSSSCWLDGSVAPVPFNSSTLNRRIQLGPLYKRNERRLIAEVTGDSDIGQLLADVLDAADDALGPLQAQPEPGEA